MTEQLKVAISSDFLTAFAKLPRQIQGKVTEFVNKFRNDPTTPGINYEKISSGLDKKIYSVRIDDTYRGIVVQVFICFCGWITTMKHINGLQISGVK